MNTSFVAMMLFQVSMVVQNQICGFNFGKTNLFSIDRRLQIENFVLGNKRLKTENGNVEGTLILR